ncbi:reverse transcriptase family protein [Christiangramia crocea]|uniref:RNA-directed DNA polymerase n=1 Tax=Christiangramia crocea TaxID=2904124 RepID=A0A9X1UVM7_9FLAO|nr:reverse transcriptase family protein [Gramella crocea]MCG9971154.1 reverse transcriptase family protein [Gramella crocea]
MKASPDQQTYIRKKFALLESKEDLLVLLNEAKRMMYGDECKVFRLKALNYYANPDFCKKRYTSFDIPKKNGAKRIINAPVKGLRSILRVLNFILQAVYEAHPAATGFVQEKSIVDNAQPHVDKHYVYNLDLQDFFHSFDRNRVKLGFMKKPFNLRKDRNKEQLAFFLSCLCTHPFKIDGNIKTVLPQGSPTSPTISNILCRDLDRRLKGLAKRFNLNFTRYADDITFSSSHNVYNKNEFQSELTRIIEEDQLLKINPSKTRLQKTGFRQEATGLVVNEKINVPKNYTKQLRMWLYYWEKYGTKKAEQIFTQDYLKDKGHVKPDHPEMENVLAGKLEFLKMVKGTDDPTYKKLQGRFLKLSMGSPLVDRVLKVWDEEGLNKAMELYYEKKESSEALTTTILTL